MSEQIGTDLNEEKTPETNQNYKKLDDVLTFVFQNDSFLSDDNKILNQKVDELIATLQKKFELNPEYSDFFKQLKENDDNAPDVNALRAKFGLLSGTDLDKKNKNFPNRKTLKELWGDIGHLSHGKNLDAVIEADSSIKQLVNEICLLVGLTPEEIEKKQREEEVKKDRFKGMSMNEIASYFRNNPEERDKLFKN